MAEIQNLPGDELAAPTRVRAAGVFSRALDLAIAAAALLFLAPLLLTVALLIAAEGKGPILFQHRRIGWRGQEFGVLKFRSMCVDADRVLERHLASNKDAAAEWAASQKLRQDPRVSALGRFLRTSSLDELPQLVNVLRGEMSLVGPRPIVEAEKAHYGTEFEIYCLVRPGITGLWQVSGRSDVSYARRVELDVQYAHSKSIFLDLSIMLATVPAVLSRKGSY